MAHINPLDDFADVLMMATERLHQMRGGIHWNVSGGKMATIAGRAGSLAVARHLLETEDGRKYLASILLDGP